MESVAKGAFLLGVGCVWGPRVVAVRGCRREGGLDGPVATGQTGTMTHDELLGRITMDPAVCHGKPCIRGHRIWVGLVLGLLEAGVSEGEILAEYPVLELADLRACLAYASELARTRLVDLVTA